MNNEFRKIITLYRGRCNSCGKIGYLYDTGSGVLNDVNCNKWFCQYCMPFLKYCLYLEIQKNVYSFNLDKHFIITFGGKELRDKINIVDSYKYMALAWDKMLRNLRHQYGYFDYILLPRAQKTGYCHYHILINKFIDWVDIDHYRKLAALGYSSINKNQSVAEYMHNDFFKSHEWFIPPNIRRVRTSRSIKINNRGKNIEKIFLNKKTGLNKIRDILYLEYGEYLDIDEYYRKKAIEQNFSRNRMVVNDGRNIK